MKHLFMLQTIKTAKGAKYQIMPDMGGTVDDVHANRTLTKLYNY
jgi:hypothetical protein